MRCDEENADVFVHQAKATRQLLENNNMQHVNPVETRAMSPPLTVRDRDLDSSESLRDVDAQPLREIVGALLWLSTKTRICSVEHCESDQRAVNSDMDSCKASASLSEGNN